MKPSSNNSQELLGFYGEAMLERIPLPIFTTDSKGLLLSLNSSAQDILGIAASELLGESIAKVLAHGKAWAKLLEKFNEQTATVEHSLEFLTRERLKVGLFVQITQERNTLGAIVGYTLVGLSAQSGKESEKLLGVRLQEKQHDIEITKRAFSNMLAEADDNRRRIENEQHKTRATLMGLEDGVLLLDKDGCISMVNTQAESILEIREADVLSKQFAKLLEFPKLAQLHKVASEQLWTTSDSERQPLLGKREFTLGDTSKKYYQLSITQAVSQTNDFGTILELHDITQEKIIDNMKSEFISIAAHQLRTPLTGINWSLDALLTGEGGAVSPDTERIIKKAAETAKNMTLVINDLLDVSRLEQSKSSFNFAAISPEEPLNKAYTSLSMKAKARHVSLALNIGDELPKVKADSFKLQMAFYNLIENAIKYSHEGNTVTVSIISTSDVDNAKSVMIIVKDEGVGIDAAEHGRIFTKFFRAKNAVKLQTEGSGLGLFIVKQIIDGHEGKIWFESVEGEGTTFYVNLPAMTEATA